MRAPLAILTLLSFLITSVIGPIPTVFAQEFRLPKPGVMVHLSPSLNPAILKGIKVHTDNPFRFDFILDKGDSSQSNDQIKEESSKLIKYFLASLTIPEKDLWVNLSPYEKDRIIPNSFGLTEMGRDLLAEDYILKQITASLIYPEDEVGKRFWKRVYEEAQAKYHTTNIPVNTFNKVWIVPEKAVVYENAAAGTAYVVESKLKVMLEGDYLSLEKNTGRGLIHQTQTEGMMNHAPTETNQIGSQIIREIVIPELTKEVNENQNFAQLRQVYNSLILATWYKKKIKDSILSQVYADKNKTAGININDPQEKEKIYQQYLQAFKKGVYNYIKEEADPITQQAIPKKYFSGGMNMTDFAQIVLQTVNHLPDSAMNNTHKVIIQANIAQAYAQNSITTEDSAMLAEAVVLGVVGAGSLTTLIAIKDDKEIPFWGKILLSAFFGPAIPFIFGPIIIGDLIGVKELPFVAQSSKQRDLLIKPVIKNLKEKDIEKARSNLIKFNKMLYSNDDYLTKIKRDDFFKLLKEFGYLINNRKDLESIGSILVNLFNNIGYADNISMIARYLTNMKGLLKNKEDLEKIILLLIDLVNTDSDLINLSIREINTFENFNNDIEELRNQIVDLIAFVKFIKESGFSEDLKRSIWHNFIRVKKNSKRYWPDLMEMEKSQNIYSLLSVFGFFDWSKGIKQEFTEVEFEEYWPEFLDIAKSSGVRQEQVFKALLVVSYLIKSRDDLKAIGNDLLELDKATYLASFEEILQSYKSTIKSKDDLNLLINAFIEIKKASGQHSSTVLHNLGHFKHLIKSVDDLKVIGSDLIEIVKAASEDGLSDSLVLLGLTTFAYLTKSEEDLKGIANDVIEIIKNTKENDLIFHLLSDFKMCIKSREDLQYWSKHWLKLDQLKRNKNFYAIQRVLEQIFQFVSAKATDIENPTFRKEILRNHMNFYLEISEKNSYRVLQNLESIFKAMKSGQVSIELTESEIRRICELSDAGFPILSEFVNSPITIGELSRMAEEIRQGAMDINNDFHVALNYTNLFNDTLYGAQSRQIDYEDFRKMVMEVREGNFNENIRGVDEQDKIQVRGLAYEAYLIRNKISELNKKAQELGRYVIVVENLSYGAVALAPITEERGAKKYIRGTDIEVWSTKIGSSESHGNEFVMRKDLFTQEQLGILTTQEPMVIVVDGSTSVSAFDRTSPHIPDGFKGYRNHFMAINRALTGKVNPKDFYQDKEFVSALTETTLFSGVVKEIQNTIKSPERQAYKFGFWYPGQKDLYVRVGKEKTDVAPKVNFQNIQDPTVIFVQSGIEPEAVPENIKEGFIKGIHVPVYFDDRDHYKNFQLAYHPGYGFVSSKAYVNYSRDTFEDLLTFLGESKLARVSPLIVKEEREVDALFLDLDGTLAQTDQKVPETVLEPLIALARKGKKIVIVTEDIEKNVDKRLTKYVPIELRNNFRFVAAGIAYTYKGNRKDYLGGYNQDGYLGDNLLQSVMGVLIDLDYFRSFKKDDRPERINPGYRMDFRVDNDFDRTEAVKAINKEFNKRGIDAKAYTVGRTSIKIARKHKEDVVRTFLAEWGIPLSKTLIIGDSARETQVDREFLSEFPGALSINVGKPSESLARDYPFVKQFQEAQGVEGTKRVLLSLAERGKVSMGLFPVAKPSMALAGAGYSSSDQAMNTAAEREKKSEVGSFNILDQEGAYVSMNEAGVSRTLDRQQTLEMLLTDPQKLYGFLKEFIDNPSDRGSQKALGLFPFIYELLYPQKNNLSPELAKVQDEQRRLDLSLVDHIFTRGLGQKITGLQQGDAQRFNKAATLSQENFQELVSRYQSFTGDVVPFFMISFMYHEISKVRNEDFRRRWALFEGVDFQLPNKASVNVLRQEYFFSDREPGLFNGIAFLKNRPHAKILSDFFYQILENRGFSGQFVRGEISYKNFKKLTDWVKAHFYELKEAIAPGVEDSQAARQITNIIFMFDFIDIASLNDQLLTDSLFVNLKSLSTDFEKVISPNIDKQFENDWQGIFDQRWNGLATLKDKKDYLKDRLLRFRKDRIRQGEDAQQLSGVIDSLNASQIEAFLKYFQNWQGWYVEQASSWLTPESQLKLIVLTGKIAELQGIPINEPFNVTFYKLMEALFDENRQLDLYKIRIVETFLRGFSWDDILLDEGRLKSLLKNDRNPLVSVGLNMDGKLAVAVDFRFTKEAEHLLGLLHTYKTSNVPTYHQMVKTLMDFYGLRKDEFDRVYNEMEYLRIMQTSKWDKERLLRYAKGPVVLDVGPAGGATLSLLEKHKEGLNIEQIVGHDISKEALSDLEKMKQREGWQHVRLVHGDAYALDKVLEKENIARPSTIIYSSILHEIFSLIPGKEFRLENVKEILRMSLKQLQVGGRLLIRDGVIPEDGEQQQEMELIGKEGWTFFEDYIREFKGREIPYEIVAQDQDFSKTRIRLKRKDAMEFLYTYTWGPNSFPYEVREQYGVLTRKQYEAMILEIAKELGMELNVVELPAGEQSYLQPGYVDYLKGKANLFDLNGHEAKMPDSNMMMVFEKRSEVTQKVGSQDPAMLKKGGIDLTPANMNLQTQSSGGEISAKGGPASGWKFILDPAMLQQLQNAPGFVPVIINIQPMTDIRVFLGISEKNSGNSMMSG